MAVMRTCTMRILMTHNNNAGYVDGGIDTMTAEKKIAFACDVVLPRWEGDKYISILDQCGGHTKDYHNHEKLICLYDVDAEGHSSRVGTARRLALSRGH